MIKHKLTFKYFSLFTLFCCAITSPRETLSAKENKTQNVPNKGYTLNFDNVSIKEFLNFISKIANVNVIYNEQDLNFNVTIISKDQTDIQNIMSALIQILRINGLTIIEEDQNLIIHKNDSVKQIPTVVSKERPLKNGETPVLITKVFQIYRGNPSNIAALITPMLSKEALIEVSQDTRRLIITDSMSSINTIEELLLSLDAPETPYDVDSFLAKNIPVEDLAILIKKIMEPIASNTVLEIITENQTSTIYIVSTPFLIERTQTILKDLDNAPILHKDTKKISSDNFLNYKLKYQNESEIKQNLEKIAQLTQQQGFASPDINNIIKNVKYIKTTNSLLFVGNSKELKIIESFLTSIDIKSNVEQPSATFITPKYKNADSIVKILHDSSEKLSKISGSSTSLIDALKNAQVLPNSNTITIYGSKEDIAKAQEIITAVDTESHIVKKEVLPTQTVFVTPKNKSANVIVKMLHDSGEKLNKTQGSSPSLIDVLKNAQVLPDSNTIILHGSNDDIAKVQEIITAVDTESYVAKKEVLPTQTVFVTPKNKSANVIVKMLHDSGEKLNKTQGSSPSLIDALKNAQVLPNSNTIILYGSSDDIAKVQEIITAVDTESYVAKKEVLPTQTVFVTPKNKSADVIVKMLHDSGEKLNKTQGSSPSLIDALKNAQVLPNSNTIILYGSSDDIAKVQEIITAVDTEPNIIKKESISTQTVFVTPKYKNSDIIVKILHDSGKRLIRSADVSPGLINTLETAQSLPMSNTIILNGTTENIDKVKELIDTNDHVAQSTAGIDVFIYQAKYMTIKELQESLINISKYAQDKTNDESTPQIIKIIETMHMIPAINSVQFMGTQQEIAKLKEIISTIDTPEHIKAKITKTGSITLVYKVKYQSPTELLTHIKQIAKDTSTSEKDNKLLQVVSTGRYASGSNSLIFTGPSTQLDKIEFLLKQLDIPELQQKPIVDRKAEVYKLYTPEHVQGNELISLIKNFENHLVVSGVIDADLSEVIDHLTYVNRTNTLIVTGKLKDVDQTIDLLKKFDTQSSSTGGSNSMGQKDRDIETIDETGFLVYKLQHQSGNNIVDALTSISTVLSKQQGNNTKNLDIINAIQSTQYIKSTNYLLTTGQPKILTRLKELMESLDRPLKQVFIEILIIETSMNDELDFGLRWGSQGTIFNKLAWGGGSYSPDDQSTKDPTGPGLLSALQNTSGTKPPTGSFFAPGGGGALGVIGDVIWHKGKSYTALGSLINALKIDSNSTIVLSQKLIAQDNKLAQIFSGSNLPFAGSIVTTSGLTQQSNANLEYRNIGTTLNITPIISENDLITLNIDEEISEQISQANESNSSTINIQGLSGLSTSKTSLTTTVHMPDQHFLILCGTMRKSVKKDVAGVPCLGGLPLIGAAFSKNNKLLSNSNVIIFVKPHIIKTPKVYGEVTKTQIELFGSSEQGDANEFNKGLEIIRSPDDESYEDAQ